MNNDKTEAFVVGFSCWRVAIATRKPLKSWFHRKNINNLWVIDDLWKVGLAQCRAWTCGQKDMGLNPSRSNRIKKNLQGQQFKSHQLPPFSPHPTSQSSQFLHFIWSWLFININYVSYIVPDDMIMSIVCRNNWKRPSLSLSSLNENWRNARRVRDCCRLNWRM